MDELADSSGLVHDQEGLRRRLAADGYLFFRGLLPADQIRAAGAAVSERLRSGGWVDDQGKPSALPRAVNPMDAVADLAFRAAVTSAAFNRIPYLPQLRSVVRRILGPDAFSYPAKVLRVTSACSSQRSGDAPVCSVIDLCPVPWTMVPAHAFADAAASTRSQHPAASNRAGAA